MNFLSKIKETVLFSSKEISLGKGSVTQYTVIENKHFFSIILYTWNTINQSRFHTHAFSAVAFLLKGWYWEKVIFNGIEMTNFVNIPLVPRSLPMNYNHCITNSKPGTKTLVFTGPWAPYWYEFFPESSKWVKYSWGRKVVSKVTSPILKPPM